MPAPPEYSPSRLFPTALPIFFTQVAGASITYSNVLLVGVLAGPTAAGAYFAAERLANLASIPKTITSLINQPSLAATSARGDHRQLQLFANQSAHGMLWPALFIGICILFFSEDMLSVFGQNFIDASSVLLILVAAGIIASLAGPAQDVLIMSGQQQLIPRVMAISAVIHIGRPRYTRAPLRRRRRRLDNPGEHQPQSVLASNPDRAPYRYYQHCLVSETLAGP